MLPSSLMSLCPHGIFLVGGGQDGCLKKASDHLHPRQPFLVGVKFSLKCHNLLWQRLELQHQTDVKTKHQMPINDCFASNGMTGRAGLMMYSMSGQAYRRHRWWGGGRGAVSKWSLWRKLFLETSEATILTWEAHVKKKDFWPVCA